MYGAGLVSHHRVLAWTGKLQAQDVLAGTLCWAELGEWLCGGGSLAMWSA